LKLKQKIVNINWDNMLGAVATAISIVGAVILLGWLIGNDASGVGALDDGAIPGVLALLADTIGKTVNYGLQV
jgi:hypothetical protein